MIFNMMNISKMQLIIHISMQFKQSKVKKALLAPSQWSQLYCFINDNAIFLKVKNQINYSSKRRDALGASIVLKSTMNIRWKNKIMIQGIVIVSTR